MVIAPGVSLSPAQVMSAPVFKNWADRLDRDWRGTVIVNNADVRGGEIHMLQVTIAQERKPWPESVTLRSETVDVLVIVTDGHHRWVVFTRQERQAASGYVYSNVAGGRDWERSPEEAAQQELTEELGLENVRVGYRIELTRLVDRPRLASPGITNELVHYMLATICVAEGDVEELLDELDRKKTGVAAEGEVITLYVIVAGESRRFIGDQTDPDSKTELSLLLAGL